MTPKEKAKELVKKYLYLYNTNINESKQCALITVDEILDMLIGSTATIDYWKEVKQEIELL
jgi:hypothetical protein